MTAETMIPSDSTSTEAPTQQPAGALACLVCGAPGAGRRFVQRGYAVYRCPECGLQFVAPIPSSSELADYYNRAYAVPLERYAAADKRNIARIADLERWCPQRGRLLEFGASYGHSLALARERGWEVVGVELSPTASEYARTHFGLSVFNCDLAEAPLAEGSFDAIVGWHVLEHVRNPRTQLQRLAALLKPRGMLGLRVPNIASFGARAAGQWWPWMCPPAHLWFFSATTLPRLLASCGFDVLETRTLRGDGNNLYQYALMAAGDRLNELRTVFGGSRASAPAAPAIGNGGDLPGASPLHASGSNATVAVGAAAVPCAAAAERAAEPSGLLQRWLRVLERAQPITDALARGTRPITEALERRGWGDELLVYARKKS